jgi:hypothetical protein
VTAVALVVASGLATENCKRKPAMPDAVAEPLEGGPYPTLLLSQAWFWKDAEGKQKPGPARLQIWRETPHGWRHSRLEDPESNVFHKAIIRDGAILTIGGEKALLSRWRFGPGGWQSERLWQRRWSGTHSRLRDLEIGDVDGDGRDEYVIATHDRGVVAIVHPPDGSGAPRVVELDEKPDTFVHEIEIGDIDGDGRRELVATPSDRNAGDRSQAGEVVLYRFDGTTYRRSVVASFPATHAKEVLLADVDHDGKDELFVVLEGEVRENRVLRPVEIREYRLQADGAFSYHTLARIDDRQSRFLLAADFNGDGRDELVATAMRGGVFLLEQPAKGAFEWKIRCIDSQSSGFEHAAVAADLDGDGVPELYVAADDQGELHRYVWDRQKGDFVRSRIGSFDSGGFTWNIAAGRL